MLERVKKPTTDFDLFDTSDVTYEIKPSRKRNEITIVLKSERDLNLVKTYLALKDLCEKIEVSLNILEGTDDIEH